MQDDTSLHTELKVCENTYRESMSWKKCTKIHKDLGQLSECTLWLMNRCENLSRKRHRYVRQDICVFTSVRLDIRIEGSAYHR